MSWASATRKAKVTAFARPTFPAHTPDWARLVSLDFETYYDDDYTLSKLSTSEYIRDPRFEALMCGIKIGRRPTKVVPGHKIRAALSAIDWSSHDLLCHHTQFDGMILSHHYQVKPRFTYCSLAMARGLHSNEIGAGLDEVSQFYGGKGKIVGGIEGFKGLRFKELIKDKPRYERSALYCGNDVEEMFRIFCLMLPQMPEDEIQLINLTNRMFIDPVLRLNVPRVEKELQRELAERKKLLLDVIDPTAYETEAKALLKTKVERELVGEDRHQLLAKRVVGSNERFAELLRAEGIEPPVKISPAWIKKDAVDRDPADKYTYAFAKDDQAFVALPDQVELLGAGLNLNKKADVQKLAARQARVQLLVDTRLAVKSTTNITRAQRFLTATANGMRLPAYYAYSRAHTHRWGGGDKRNMQNLIRGGELRESIEAEKGHVLNVVDSGQIEARVNAMLWGQDDLLADFVAADSWDKAKGVARGKDRDAYCKMADLIYGKEVTTLDKLERFVGKTCIAEGQLVLTERGLVPIEQVLLTDRLWDGMEWVSHSGVIDQGVRDVVSYNGLEATSDHEVFTEDGRIVSLGQAASEMVGLQQTGTAGSAIRFSDDHVTPHTPRQWLSVCRGSVCSVGNQEAGLSQQSEKRQDNFLSSEWASASSERRRAGPSLRRNQSTMRRSNPPEVEGLWRPGHQVPFQESHELHYLGEQESPTSELQGCGDRSPKQRQTLQPGQSAVGHTTRTDSEPSQYVQGSMERQADPSGAVSQSVRCQLDVQAGEARSDRQPNTRKVRVFDIANAGPRFRYTVSGCLVLNCILGLGFQMGAPKLQMTFAKGTGGAPKVYFELDKCVSIVNAYRRKNHKIAKGWEICKGIIEDMAVGREGAHGPISWEKGCIWLPNGMQLRYPDLKKRAGDKGWDEWTYQAGDQRKKIYGGLLCENIVQALARIIIAGQMLVIDTFTRVVMTTHDEVVAMTKKLRAESVQKKMIKVLRTPPAWWPGIPLNAEGGYAENYSK